MTFDAAGFVLPSSSQGITGLSTLAIGSSIAVAGICAAGSVATLKYMLSREEQSG